MGHSHSSSTEPPLTENRRSDFEAPTREERVLYAKYWQKKLKDNKNVSFPDSLIETIADLTDKFSFAFMKEAM